MKTTIGNIVHFVMPGLKEYDGTPVERPAIITRVWSPEMVQLQVFTDGSNDKTDNVVWHTSVHYDENKSERSWHWPESE